MKRMQKKENQERKQISPAENHICLQRWHNNNRNKENGNGRREKKPFHTDDDGNEVVGATIQTDLIIAIIFVYYSMYETWNIQCAQKS